VLPYMAQTCPQLPYMAQTCPQNILSKPLCHRLLVKPGTPEQRNTGTRNIGTPEQHHSGTRNTGTLKILNLLKIRRKKYRGV
jgi:hypothetical protein